MEERKPNPPGQAILEYVLMMVLVTMAVSAIAISFRTSLMRLWGDLGGRIAAPCPSAECLKMYQDQNPGVKIDPGKLKSRK